VVDDASPPLVRGTGSGGPPVWFQHFLRLRFARQRVAGWLHIARCSCSCRHSRWPRTTSYLRRYGTAQQLPGIEALSSRRVSLPAGPPVLGAPSPDSATRRRQHDLTTPGHQITLTLQAATSGGGGAVHTTPPSHLRHASLIAIRAEPHRPTFPKPLHRCHGFSVIPTAPVAKW
jgi:hypothetical protein